MVSRARCLRSLTRPVVKRAANALILTHFKVRSALSGERNVRPKPARKFNICKKYEPDDIPLKKSAMSVLKYPRSLKTFSDEILYRAEQVSMSQPRGRQVIGGPTIQIMIFRANQLKSLLSI